MVLRRLAGEGKAVSFSSTFSYAILRALDIAVACFFWPMRDRSGPTGLTISTHAFLDLPKGYRWARFVYWLTEKFEKDHCYKAAVGDRDNATRAAILVGAAIDSRKP